MNMIVKRLILTLLGVVAGTMPLGAQTIEYYHVDAVGSVRAVTDASGNVIRRHDYFPFGEEYAATPGTDPLRSLEKSAMPRRDSITSAPATMRSAQDGLRRLILATSTATSSIRRAGTRTPTRGTTR